MSNLVFIRFYEECQAYFGVYQANDIFLCVASKILDNFSGMKYVLFV